MPGDVVNDAAASRYELEMDGETAFAAYERRGDVIVFTHTIVPPPIEGHGIASRLIKAALDDVRRQGLRLVPECSFVAAYIERHPETRDLLADAG